MVEPLRVLVIGNLPTHVLGGAENQVARLVGQWLASGLKVEVAGHRIPDGMQTLGQHPLRTHRIGSWRLGGRAGRALGYFVSMVRLCVARRGDFDVVYCRGLGDGAVSLAILSALGLCRWRIIGVPINARGTGDAHFLRSIPGWRLWCSLLDRELRAVNLINREIAADLDALGITRPARHSIPNGVVLGPAVVRDRVAPVRRLVWTGRFERQKGLDLLLPALADCWREGRRFELALYGDGALRPALEAQVAQLGLGAAVRFMGPVAEDHVRRALAEADVFVLPSRYEGMSNSALEAMEAGLPVLCTRCGGIDVAIADGAGWVCAPDDAASLLASLRQLFAAPDEELLACGRRGRALVERDYCIEVVARRNIQLIASVAGSRRSP